MPVRGGPPPPDEFQRSYDKVAGRVSFYINSVTFTGKRRDGGRSETEREGREASCIISRAERRTSSLYGCTYDPRRHSVFLLQRCSDTAEQPCTDTRTRRRREVYDRSVTLQPTGNKVGCGTTDCHHRHKTSSRSKATRRDATRRESRSLRDGNPARPVEIARAIVLCILLQLFTRDRKYAEFPQMLENLFPIGAVGNV